VYNDGLHVAMPTIHSAAAAIGRQGWRSLHRLSFAPIALSQAAISAPMFDLRRVASTNAARQVDSLRYLQQRSLSSSSSISSSNNNSSVTTSMTIGESSDNKSIMSKLWDKYSIEGQKKRIILGERLFRAAQYRANDPRWFTEARIPYEFRPRHALISMHIWFIHKRLLADRVDSHLALLVQEELFDILWNDTRARIRAEGVHELTVNKHLKDAQQLTFLQCTHYDHSFQEFASDDKKRLQEISGVNWTYVLNKDEEANEDLLKRLTMYVEYQCVNLLQGVPDNYFWEGRIPWGDMPEFATMKDNNGKELPALESVPGMEVFPAPWVKTLTDAGVPYYWNMDTDETTWKKPT
jgi:cytochrome b pre-mRNA-processing protein 3